MTKRKSTDWPHTVTNTWDFSGAIRTGACVGASRNLQSWLSWESDPWNLHLSGQCLLQCRLQSLSFADCIRSWRHLRCLRAIPLRAPILFRVIASSSLFTWVPREIFLRLFKNGSDSHYQCFSLFLCLYLSFFLPLIVPAIIDCLSQFHQII